MRKTFAFFGAILIVSMLLMSSCALDEEIIPDDPIDLYLGTWMVSDNAMKVTYEVIIERNPNNSSEVLLQNFAGSSSTATALVTGKYLTITSPVIGNNWSVSGSGNYKSSYRIDFNYNLSIGGSSEDRFALFSR